MTLLAFNPVMFTFALIISLVQAAVYVLTGLYSQPKDIGTGICLPLLIQLIVATLIVILLDELLQKGHGLDSGTTCSSPLTSATSPPPPSTIGRGSEFQGVIVALHLLLT
ncbi:hypothetical protein BDZ97DRAFT_1917905 [Flammula alnicola]|nr:hypothetical protein BDZ97DRAFT_1917905 [Flammula alnicola]